MRRFWNDFNRRVEDAVLDFNPDLYFTLNESCTYPETLNRLKSKTKCTYACWVVDNPFDPGRFKYLPASFKHFCHIFIGEMAWRANISMIAPKSKIHSLIGAYDPGVFKPLGEPVSRKSHLACDIAFAGTGYGMKVEGVYRAEILNAVADMDLKFWGDCWEWHLERYPRLKQCYQGGRLSLEGLNRMNQEGRVILNIANPQCITSFQQRTLEIAASCGFQLADYKSDIYTIFGRDEVISFDSGDDLLKKINFYNQLERKRKECARKAHERIKNRHTYLHRMREMLEMMKL